MNYRADLLKEIRVSFPVSRDALYAEIWSEPMTTVAARYGVSSSFLARVCDGLTIPRPPRGYWAKRAVGKRVAQPALPSVRPGVSTPKRIAHFHQQELHTLGGG